MGLVFGQLSLGQGIDIRKFWPVTGSHRSVNYDHPGEFSPEKDCL